VLERQGHDYVLMDTSTNGTFLNYQPDRLDTAPSPLNQGDVIIVGEFELVVQIKATVVEDTAADLPPLEPVSGSETAPPLPAAAPAPAPLDAGENAFLDELLGGPAVAPAKPETGPKPLLEPGASAPNHTPAAQDYFAPDGPKQQVIPDDWEDSLIAPLPDMAPGTTPTPKPSAPPGAPDAALAAFVRGLGVANLKIEPAQSAEVMERMGRVMAAMIGGMREVMMARAALKSEMRMARTMIQPDRNNPLKFSLTTDQAIEAIVRPMGHGYQDPEDATAEVLRDIKAHEVATMSGMEAALKDLLEQLSPEQLSSRIEEKSSVSSLLGNRKAKSWEAYERHYTELRRQTEDDFQATFGKEFARAYENQIKKL
jgi:type VI secretion system FHA domain protein